MAVLRPFTLIATLLSTSHAAFPSSLLVSHPVAINRISDINVTCDSSIFNITVTMEQPFKGVLFAKDFSQSCRSFGVMSSTLTLSLPTSGCGVRLISDANTEDGRMYYSMTVVLQQDKYLRQITDQERVVRCYVANDVFLVKSKPLEDLIKEEIKDFHQRKGRMRDNGWSRRGEDDHDEEINGKILADALSAARAWMEIIPVKGNGNSPALQVGEPTMLMVKATLPAGIDWRVVECIAHDGLGDSSQKLLDENGCPVDEFILPALSKQTARPIALMRHQEAIAEFAAFKFPDRDRLHLSCGLQLCRRACQEANCSSSKNKTTGSDNRFARNLSKKQQPGEVVDRLEVYNSVEVKAPGIELEEDFRKSERYENNEKNPSPFGNIPGDRTFCVSPDKMALAFCLLGIIFLCAVLVAAWSLLRARRSNTNLPYYTRSLFSSSTESAYGGSKLLLQDSPCMGHPSRTLHAYGRIL